MPPVPQISSAEWEVMKVLWRQSEPSSAQIVIDALAEPNDWSPATIKTLLNRLVNKGALTFQKQGNAYLYSPAVTAADCQAAEAESFLDRVFDGSLSPLVAHFAKSRRLRKDEIKQLEELLRHARKP